MMIINLPKLDIVQTIKGFLDNLENVHTTQEKSMISIELFSFLSLDSVFWFFENAHHFRNVLIGKYYVLKQHNDPLRAGLIAYLNSISDFVTRLENIPSPA